MYWCDIIITRLQKYAFLPLSPNFIGVNLRCMLYFAFFCDGQLKKSANRKLLLSFLCLCVGIYPITS